MAKKDEAAIDTDPPDFGSVDDPVGETAGAEAAAVTSDDGNTKDAAALAAALAAVVDDTPPEPAVVPIARFNRQNDKLATTLAENERLKGELAGVRSVAQPKAAGETPKPVDIRALLKASKDAMLEGDSEKATDIDMQIEAERERKRTEGHAAAKAEALQEFRQEQAQTELHRVALQMVKDYPFLDERSAAFNEDAQKEVIDAREYYVTVKHMSPGDALKKAVERVAPEFGDKAAGGGKAVDDLGAKRQAEALKRAGATSLAQPQPLAGGVGARSGASALTAKNMSPEQIKALSTDKKGLESMFAGNLGGT